MSTKKAHSVPVPRLYKEAANIRKKVNQGEGLKELVFNSKHRNIKAVYALVCNSIRNDTLLNAILEESGILNDKFDTDLAKILVTEILWGKKSLPGNCKPVQVVTEFLPALKKAEKNCGVPVSIEKAHKPRYVRVNTLLTTVNGSTQRFVDDGWQLLDTPESYKDFIETITNLEEDQFIKDYHFKDCLVFPAKTELHNHKLVENGSLILQDKASCLPANLLNPEPGSVVLDMCAAPGLKTSHLASFMQNKGTVHAVDIVPKRYQTMLEYIKIHCGMHSCVECHLGDATKLSSKQYPGVQYILVDPSCSGTGMSKRIEDSDDVTASSDDNRIQRLASFQERLLIQALTSFPDAERVVYSTCSILEEENEKVIEKVLARVPSFQVVAPKLEKDWEHRGNQKYSFGSDCCVADESDVTNGFFVAVMERVDKTHHMKTSETSLKRKSTTADDGWEFPKTKTKKKKKQEQMEIEDNVDETEME